MPVHSEGPLAKSVIGHRADAQDVIDLLGASANRLEVLRFVLRQDQATALEVMAALGLTRNGVGKHLEALTAAGFLSARRATHPRGSGDVIYWSGRRDRIARVLWSLAGEFIFEDEA
ncbi:helix-turn-helix domain-containing protein [Microbacterium sp. NPDC055665]